ncbi:MAG TPA: Ig-like domain-containing protein, partial [Gemmatimonadales bacterium]|nr:Ig-like domain-containing protein [Gemmatimonadales bacterium]
MRDPVGPGGVFIIQRLTSPLDSLLVGAPGRSLSEPIQFQALDGDGNPVAGAGVEWSVKGGHVEHPATTTDQQGRFSIEWVLGTRAADREELTVTVQSGGHRAMDAVVAIPTASEIVQLAFATDTNTIEVGQPTTIGLRATDPFGNTFTPVAVQLTCGDPAICRVDSTGAVNGTKRGWTKLVAHAGVVADTGWVHTTQVVKSIVVTPSTLRFHALGQTAQLAVQLLDAHGLPVTDSLPSDSLQADSVARVQAGSTYTVQSVLNGTTRLILSAGAASQEVRVVVNQHVAAVHAASARTQLDALGDTVRVAVSAFDSLNVLLTNQRLLFGAADSSVASVDSAGLVTARANGSTWVRAFATNGVADSVQFTVLQQVARVQANQAALEFQSLHAVQPLAVVALDRLGSPVAGAKVSYASADPTVVSVDLGGNVRAVGNGATQLTASVLNFSATIAAHVAQRVVRIAVPFDTVRFTALGDTARIQGVPVDSLGVPASYAAVSLAIADTSVVQRNDSDNVRARGNGSTVATLTAGELSVPVQLVVDQVPVTMTASVTFANPVLTLPVGAVLPVACRVLDRNGFAVNRVPALIRTVQGTVTGTGCADARVAHSGYDTLVFALGSVQATVPVIVATAPDSVGVIAASQPLTTVTRDQYLGENLSNPLILALRPLVSDILAAYGNPTSSLDRARALRDWVSRTAVHPYRALHPNGSTSNLSVLPPGKTWADANAAASPKIDQDTKFWGSVGLNG